MVFQRARSDEQKEKRLQQIMAATEKLLLKYNYADINLKLIAEELDFTRANLYKYINTKEEIFLLIFQQHLHNWVEAMLAEFADVELPIADEVFAKLWSQSIAEQKTLLKVRPLLNAIIEENVAIDNFIEFKSAIWQDSYRLLPILQGQLPFLDRLEGKEFLASLMIYAGALSAASETFTKHWKLLKICDSELQRLDFQAAFQQFLYIELSGLRVVKGNCVDKI